MPRREWLTEEPPRAVILGLHGFNDYSNAFEEFGAYAAARGVAVARLRPAGLRRQSGRRPVAGHAAPGRETWHGERRRLAALYPGVPVYLLGESMGAAVLSPRSRTMRALDSAGTDHDRPGGVGRG